MVKYMKNEISYTDEPMGEVRIIDDFLPAPDALVFRKEVTKKKKETDCSDEK